ncbi:MAG: death on curing protein [Patescibacteria group bacterium]|nr:death on curing protein [Patescibacteria group bacterium]
MNYVSAEDLLVLHAMIIDASGGSNGVRDPHLLASIAEKPAACFGGADLYPTLWNKAAILFEGLVNYHVFVDGNKRTGFVATARFLSMNGYTFIASNEDVVTTTLNVATKNISQEELANWLETNSEAS